LYVKYSNCGANVVIFLIYTLGGAILLPIVGVVRAKQIKFCAPRGKNNGQERILPIEY
jgi:hypothetical protein